MTIRINEYEIEIKAKDVEIFERKNFNKGDTKAFLNGISSLLYSLSDRTRNSEKPNSDYFADKAEKLAHEIHAQLDAVGYYDKYK